MQGSCLRPTSLCCAFWQEGTLWGLLTILSLLAGLAAGTPRMPHCNETLDTALTSQSAPVEDGAEVPLATAWSQLQGRCWCRNPCNGMGMGRLETTLGAPVCVGVLSWGS